MEPGLAIYAVAYAYASLVDHVTTAIGKRLGYAEANPLGVRGIHARMLSLASGIAVYALGLEALALWLLAAYMLAGLNNLHVIASGLEEPQQV